jgi:GNAT superfamily N-acetyltransferase
VHEFGADPVLLAQRQCYLCTADGRTIGTATAWFDDDFGGEIFGRVHWVAIVPQYQGHGLSRPLLSAVCERLREAGHERAYLTTSSARLAAIRLYLRFGFKPLIETEGQASAWRTLLEQIEFR